MLKSVSVYERQEGVCVANRSKPCRGKKPKGNGFVWGCETQKRGGAVFVPWSADSRSLILCNLMDDRCCTDAKLILILP